MSSTQRPLEPLPAKAPAIISKADRSKYQPTLIYTSLIKAIAKVREHGRQKYGGTETWPGNPPTFQFNAMLRHVYAHLDGEYWDMDSELPHLHLAATNLMFEIERIARTVNSPIDIGIEVEIKCPRCGSTDLYLLKGIHPCTNDCGYMIDPTIA